MRAILSILVLIIGSGSGYCQTTEVAEVDDLDLVFLLNQMEIIAESAERGSGHSRYAVRIVRVRQDGECDGTPQSCPMEIVYIAVSSFDEYPDRMLFRLPDAYRWQFEGWNYVPEMDASEDAVRFGMIKTVVAQDTTTGWWAKEYFEVTVNLRSATLMNVSK